MVTEGEALSQGEAVTHPLRQKQKQKLKHKKYVNLLIWVVEFQKMIMKVVIKLN